jgi:hypothetical protein
MMWRRWGMRGVGLGRGLSVDCECECEKRILRFAQNDKVWWETE